MPNDVSESVPFDAWSYTRRAIEYGVAIEQDSRKQDRTYEQHSVTIDLRASFLAKELKDQLTRLQAKRDEAVGLLDIGTEAGNHLAMRELASYPNGSEALRYWNDHEINACAFLARIRAGADNAKGGEKP
jgi:hypothetical protein